MATNTTVLLTGLREYDASLKRHTAQLRTEYESLEGRWRAFSTVYEGAAADQFRAHWERTASAFREYIDRTQKIEKILEERIGFLNQANQQGSL